MDVDFDAAARRFAKDQRSRKDAAKDKAQQREAERRAQAARRARWEAEAAARREAEAEQLAREAAAREEDLERNRGVAFVQTLRPELTLAAETKGIVRRADKITLPRSASLDLERQQASRHGQLFFELSNASTGRTTHASILDFSAPEGTVGLPAEVLANLGLTADMMAPEVRPQITVRYRALKRGTFAKVQPVKAAFATDVGDVKALLERELHFRTTLSAGDELKVSDVEGALGTYAPAETYALRIVALEPDGAASIIDTDLEVDVLPSVEAEEAAKAEAEAAAARQAALEAAVRAKAEAAAAAEREQAAAAAQAAAEAAAARQARQARREAALAALPAEPASAGGEGVQVQVRCPDGTRCTRRFDPRASTAVLFALVEASAWEMEFPPSADFTLAASYPRRVVRRADADAGRTLAEVGVTAKQEALFVELVQAPCDEAAVPMEAS